MTQRKLRRRGTTIVEVMMALSCLAIGVSGLVAMQKVAMVANRDAKNLEVANQIARTWIERLKGDALLWNHPSPIDSSQFDIKDTIWINKICGKSDSTLTNPMCPNMGQSGRWFRPNNTDFHLYGAHNALGADLTDDTTKSSPNGPFCVQLRLTWVKPPPGQLIRAEVMVYWLRQGIQYSGASSVVDSPLCGASGTADSPPDVQSKPDIYHIVQVATAITQNTAY